MIPSFIDGMSWRMAEVYEAVTDRILINMASYFPYIKYGSEPKDLFQYQARMLAQMGQLNKETVAIIADSLGGADEALKDALEASIREALKDEEPLLRKAVEAGYLHPGKIPELTPNQMHAFWSYYQQSADKLNLVNTVMLESTQSAYQATVADIVSRMQTTQGILNTAAGEAVTGVSPMNEIIRSSVGKMLDNGITGFIDHGGHHWSPEAYVAMDVRTTMANTARAAIWERSEQYGNDLYQVSWHDGARPLCYPWQTKVISRNNFSGEVEDEEGNLIHVYPQSETSYGEAAGLFGINCKHYPIPFVPGFSRIRQQEQTEAENNKEYRESQEQRALERGLREERRDLQAAKARNDPAEIDMQKKRVQDAEDRLNSFCQETGRNRRRSREYTPIMATFPDE